MLLRFGYDREPCVVVEVLSLGSALVLSVLVEDTAPGHLWRLVNPTAPRCPPGTDGQGGKVRPIIHL